MLSLLKRIGHLRTFSLFSLFLLVTCCAIACGVYADYLRRSRPFRQPIELSHSSYAINGHVNDEHFAGFGAAEPYDIRDVLYFDARRCRFVEYRREFLAKAEIAGDRAGMWIGADAYTPYVLDTLCTVDAAERDLLKSEWDCEHAMAVFLPRPLNDWTPLCRVRNTKALLIWNPDAQSTSSDPLVPKWSDPTHRRSLNVLLVTSLCHQIELLQLPGGDEITTDETLIHVSPLRQLRGLSLWNTNITNQGLVHLVPLQRLLVLNLDGCEITDEGLRHVGKLRSLKSLSLNGTKITDDGLDHLTSLDNLIELRVYATDIRKQKFDELQTKMPKLKYIEYGTDGKEPLIIP